MTKRLQSGHCPAPPANHAPSPPSPLTCKKDAVPNINPQSPKKIPVTLPTQQRIEKRAKKEKGQLNSPVLGPPRIQGVSYAMPRPMPFLPEPAWNNTELASGKIANVPRMWPPIASWTTITVDTCAPAADASQVPERDDLKESWRCCSSIWAISRVRAIRDENYY
ncbi:uncharacterized protein TRIVIDRAFT_69937 [Trichoderma virens Gv29-8]|uniref:Uncharacterized protein n=1 Tax=Hypocrea virens (strain Gv29-8 / FGSC 10586) TaxID=413071 RepID=G9N4M0_HYPVG|nr:uncharacterized protein TRIVIDRAFT_69937 [Trichoderma virens Gv29-8]EHK18544.1 hypothetical protein TRIVIDRAFT_69937 [Trichoderma virens Gv29-8]UKZ52751.1 hypothetical protein TrVGV298_006538 [Trichoderma virens]